MSSGSFLKMILKQKLTNQPTNQPNIIWFQVIINNP